MARRGLLGGDVIRLVATGGSETVVLAELDGRYWRYDTAKCFTGRGVGVHAGRGSVRVVEVGYDGRVSSDGTDTAFVDALTAE